MSSTNKTTHYNLSQYVASDKPTYLVDYNADMSAIDSGIYAAKSEADTNTTSIGDLTTLTTTEKTNLVGAINEVDGNVDTLSGTVGQHTTDIADNTSAIGNLANLDTTAKTSLVAAINEVNGKTDVYDTTETLTSEVWESHPIYRKVYDVTFSGLGNIEITANLSNCKIVRMFGIDISSNGSEFPMPNTRPTQPSYELGLYYNGSSDKIIIETSGNVNRDGHTGWVCVEYYKVPTE